jgi:pantoate--beta-alanine ligase
MSSRNQYLSPEERAVAGRFNVILREAVAELEAGGPIATIEAEVERRLIDAGFSSVDYVAVRGAGDLSTLDEDAVGRPSRLLAAARIGATRLIDNFAVEARGAVRSLSSP